VKEYLVNLGVACERIFVKQIVTCERIFNGVSQKWL